MPLAARGPFILKAKRGRPLRAFTPSSYKLLNLRVALLTFVEKGMLRRQEKQVVGHGTLTAEL
jgi:hypothetical protein